MSDPRDRAHDKVLALPGQRHLLAVVEVLVMMIRADGEVSHEEILHLMGDLLDAPPFTAVDRSALLQMIYRAQKLQPKPEDVSARLRRLSTVLDPDLRRLVYAMIHDLRAVDGHVDEREVRLLAQVRDAFGLQDGETAR